MVMKRRPILVVDDDAQVRALLARVLRNGGYDVAVASDAEEALEAVTRTSFGVVVSDIVMPGRSGIDLIRELRRREIDVPVVLVTGTPCLDTAVAAVECGAARYLTKPVDIEAFTSAVARAETLSRLARAKRDASEPYGEGAVSLGDEGSLEARFESACASMWMAFQPIVSHASERIVAFEALLRTEEPSLRSPLAFVAAADRVGRLMELGRRVRAETARSLSELPLGADVFVNLHAFDISDDELVGPDSPLSHFAPRVVLELTERASLERVPDAKSRIEALRKLGFRIAIDDLGAGYAGLGWLATFDPDVVKIDMGLIRHVDTDATRQRVVESLIDLCRQLAIRVVVEGIETVAERDTIAHLGGDIMQGYHFARPSRGFVQVADEAWAAAERRVFGEARDMGVGVTVTTNAASRR